MQWLAQKEEEGGMVKDTARARGQDGLACRPPDLLGSPSLDEQRARGRERSGRERETELRIFFAFSAAGAAAARENSPKAGEFRIDDGGRSACDDIRQTDGRDGGSVDGRAHSLQSGRDDRKRAEADFAASLGRPALEMRDGGAIDRPLILIQSRVSQRQLANWIDSEPIVHFRHTAGDDRACQAERRPRDAAATAASESWPSDTVARE